MFTNFPQIQLVNVGSTMGRSRRNHTDKRFLVHSESKITLPIIAHLRDPYWPCNILAYGSPVIIVVIAGTSGLSGAT